MKKIYFIIMLVLAGVFAQAQTSVWDGTRQIWTNGSGTQDDPYLIESASNLAFLAYMVGKAYDTYGLYFKLTTDIDLNGSEDLQWIPIGLYNRAYDEDGCERNACPVFVSREDLAFKGHFDGDNHNISNLYVNKDLNNYSAGLFGFVAFDAVIENVIVTNGIVKGVYSGGIVGTCWDSRDSVLISRCLNGADIEGSRAGGIVGKSANKVYNCKNTGWVYGRVAAGGIVGESVKEVVECSNSGNIMGDGFVGGLIGGGPSLRTYIVNNCYNTGDISSAGINVPNGAPGIIGGLVGLSYKSGTITNCYNVGTVSCSNEDYEPGALAGRFGEIITNSYYLNTCGGVGNDSVDWSKTADEMRDPAFVDILNYETNVWCADTLNSNDGYPILGANNLEVEDVVAKPLAMYPNPSHGHFTVEGTGFVVVINVLGQQVLARRIEGPTMVELPQGIYFVRLQNENEVRTGKIVVN